MKSLIIYGLLLLICGGAYSQDTINYKVTRIATQKNHHRPGNDERRNMRNSGQGNMEENSAYDEAIKSPVLKVERKLDVRPLFTVFNPAELKNKAIVMIFWSSEVPESSYAFADLGEIFKKYGHSEDVVVVALTMDSKKVAAAKLKKNPLLYAEHVSQAAPIINAYKLRSFPSYIITDKDHVIRYAARGGSEALLPSFQSTLETVLK